MITCKSSKTTKKASNGHASTLFLLEIKTQWFKSYEKKTFKTEN